MCRRHNLKDKEKRETKQVSIIVIEILAGNCVSKIACDNNMTVLFGAAGLNSVHFLNGVVTLFPSQTPSAHVTEGLSGIRDVQHNVVFCHEFP